MYFSATERLDFLENFVPVKSTTAGDFAKIPYHVTDIFLDSAICSLPELVDALPVLSEIDTSSLEFFPKYVENYTVDMRITDMRKIGAEIEERADGAVVISHWRDISTIIHDPEISAEHEIFAAVLEVA